MRLCYYTRSCFLLVLFTAISYYHANTQTLFIGADGGDWFTATNWNNGLPATGNDATIPNGKTVVISQALNVTFNIQSFGGLKNTAALTLATNLVSGGAITNSGTLTINSGITLTSSGGITNTGTIINNGSCNSNSAFTNSSTGIVNNNSSWTQQAAITNSGTFNNNAGTFTCPQLFTNNSIVKNAAGANFKVDFGGTFTNAAGSTLSNAGSFSNLGTFVNTTTVTNTGSFTNNGSHTCNGVFNNESGSSLNSTATLDINGRINNKVGGTVTNSFNFNVNATGYLSNAGNLTNANTITTLLGGTFCNEAATGVVTTNFGSKIVNGGYFKNALGAKVSGNGSLTTTAKVDNFGTFEANDGSQVTIGDTLNNAGVFKSVNIFNNNGVVNNSGDMQSLSGGTFNNFKTVLNIKGGKFTNFYEYYNKLNATTTNNGAFINNVRVFNESLFTNNAYLLIVGDFFNRSTGTLANSEVIEVSEGSIVNEGTLTNAKTVYLDQCSVFSNKATVNNQGAIISSALVFQRGTISGNAINVKAGFIQIGVTSTAAICRASLSTGTDLIGEAKVYGQNPVLPNIGIDSCAGFQYFIEGTTRKVFTCAQVGQTITGHFKLLVRTGDSLTCTIPITIFDGVPPTLANCPTDVKVLTKNTTEKYSWTAPTVADNCDAAPTVVSNITSGASFNLGKTEVVITARDKSNNAKDCRFIVNLVQVPDGGVCSATSAAPVFSNCPANIAVTVANGNAAAVWNEPSVAGACLPIVITASSVSGSLFPAGVTTVTYAATDVNKKASTCSFTVTVTSGDVCANDNIAPVINNCPSNIFVATNTIINGAVGVWKAPTATDNCGGVNLVGNATSGSIFPNGTTTVTYTATDTKNNTSVCTFSVNVAATNPCAGDITPPTVSGCPANITQNTTGTSAVVTWTEPTATDACAPVTTNKTNTPGSNFQIGTTTVKYFFSDKVGNTSGCTFNVIVNNPCFNDTLAPVLGACPGDITVSTSGTSATATWTNPTATDNCGTVTVTSSPMPGSTFAIGVTTVTVNAFDAKANKSSCTFKVTVNSKVSCSTSINLALKKPALQSTTISGYGTLGSASAAVDGNTDGNFQSGSVTHTACSAGDWWQVDLLYASNIQNIKVWNRTDCCVERIYNSILLVSDNPFGSNDLNVLKNTVGISTYNLGSFNISTVIQINRTGRYVRIYNGNNTSNCLSLAEVEVNGCLVNPCDSDITPPTLGACPADITVNAVTGATTGIASWVNPTATDNCGTPTVVSSPLAGSNFQIGTTTVTVTATDAKANKSSCTFKVFVNAATSNCVVPPTPAGWMLLGTLGNNTYFKYTGSDATFANAKAYITSIGGRFPTISNNSINSFISNAVNGNFWTGITRNGSNWTNYDGTNATYFNWHAGEPNNYNGIENNVEVYGDGTWNDINENAYAWTIAEVPCSSTPTCTRTKGSITREIWTNVSGNSISDLTNNASYPNAPTTKTILNNFILGQNSDANTGDRVRGFIYPPITGAYKFTVYGDDQTNLYLSTDNSAANKTIICNVNTWTNEGEFTREANQVSQTINLVAGKEYYIELLHKQGGGGNNFGVLWTLPNAAAPILVTGNFLAPYDNCTPAPTICTTKGTYFYERWLNINYNWAIPITMPNNVVNEVIVQNPLDFQMPVANRDVNYLSRARGYITAPESGDYYFNVTGDDYDELYLSNSTDETKIQKIAYHYGWCGTTEYNKFATQTSGKITLVAGQQYYFDFRHYQGYGGDDFHISWKKPSCPNNWNVIPSGSLSYPCNIQKTAAQSTKVFDFELTASNRQANISWLSNQGTSVDFYTVEKLNTDGNFVAIFKTTGANGTDKITNFSFADTKTQDGDNFYRIVTTYKDGTESVSEIKKVSFSTVGGLFVYPNPTDDQLDIDLSNYEGKAVDLSIYNATGQSVFHFNFESAPRSAYRVNTETFSLGAHLIKVDVKGLKSITKQIIIAR